MRPVHDDLAFTIAYGGELPRSWQASLAARAQQKARLLGGVLEQQVER